MMPVIEMERYFAKSLEGSAPTVNEGNGMPTQAKPKRGVKEVWGRRGGTKFYERS